MKDFVRIWNMVHGESVLMALLLGDDFGVKMHHSNGGQGGEAAWIAL